MIDFSKFLTREEASAVFQAITDHTIGNATLPEPLCGWNQDRFRTHPGLARATPSALRNLYNFGAVSSIGSILLWSTPFPVNTPLEFPPGVSDQDREFMDRLVKAANSCDFNSSLQKELVTFMLTLRGGKIDRVFVKTLLDSNQYSITPGSSYSFELIRTAQARGWGNPIKCGFIAPMDNQNSHNYTLNEPTFIPNTNREPSGAYRRLPGNTPDGLSNLSAGNCLLGNGSRMRPVTVDECMEFFIPVGENRLRSVLSGILGANLADNLFSVGGAFRDPEYMSSIYANGLDNIKYLLDHPEQEAAPATPARRSRVSPQLYFTIDNSQSGAIEPTYARATVGGVAPALAPDEEHEEDHEGEYEEEPEPGF